MRHLFLSEPEIVKLSRNEFDQIMLGSTLPFARFAFLEVAVVMVLFDFEVILIEIFLKQ